MGSTLTTPRHDLLRRLKMGRPKGSTLTEEHKRKIRETLKGEYRGEKNSRWNGGRIKNSNGYIFIVKREHPLSSKHGYVLEHRLVMEKKLGRYLTPEETIHHINGIRDDNREENLCLINGKNHGTYTLQHILQQQIIELENKLSVALQKLNYYTQ